MNKSDLEIAATQDDSAQFLRAISKGCGYSAAAICALALISGYEFLIGPCGAVAILSFASGWLARRPWLLTYDFLDEVRRQTPAPKKLGPGRRWLRVVIRPSVWALLAMLTGGVGGVIHHWLRTGEGGWTIRLMIVGSLVVGLQYGLFVAPFQVDSALRANPELARRHRVPDRSWRHIFAEGIVVAGAGTFVLLVIVGIALS